MSRLLLALLFLITDLSGYAHANTVPEVNPGFLTGGTGLLIAGCLLMAHSRRKKSVQVFTESSGPCPQL